MYRLTALWYYVLCYSHHTVLCFSSSDLLNRQELNESKHTNCSTVQSSPIQQITTDKLSWWKTSTHERNQKRNRCADWWPNIEQPLWRRNTRLLPVQSHPVPQTSEQSGVSYFTALDQSSAALNSLRSCLWLARLLCCDDWMIQMPLSLPVSHAISSILQLATDIIKSESLYIVEHVL